MNSSSLNSPVLRLRGPETITLRGEWAEPLDKTINGLVHQCCYCKKVRTESGKWEHRLIDIDKTTHGFCPTCYDRELAKVQALINIRKAKLKLKLTLGVLCLV